MAKRGGGMKSGDLLMYGGLAFIVYMMGKGTPLWGGAAGQVPMKWWIRPDGDVSTIVFAFGVTAPITGYRPASNTELAEAGIPDTNVAGTL